MKTSSFPAIKAVWVIVFVAASALFATLASAQTNIELQAEKQAAIAAFQNGDPVKALAHSNAAVKLARAIPDLPALEFATTLGDLAFLLGNNPNPSPRAQSLWYEALALLAEDNELATIGGATILYSLADYELQHGLKAQGLARLDTLLQTVRGAPTHGVAANAVMELFLKNGAFPQAIVALGEVTQIAPEMLYNSYADLHARLTEYLELAESDGRQNDVVTLLEGKQILLRTYVPEEQSAEAVRNLYFQRVFALRNSDDYQRVENEIALWLQSGTPTDDEIAFLQAQTDAALVVAEDVVITTPDQLNTARTVLAYTAGLAGLDDHRIGLAHRTVATAESELSLYTDANRSLTKAIDILKRTDIGRLHLPSAYLDMAWNAYLMGEVQRAQALFDAADRAQLAASALGDDPISNRDHSYYAIRRANFYLAIGQPTKAEEWRAKAHFGDQADGYSSWDQALLNVRDAQVSFVSGMSKDQRGAAVQRLIDAIGLLRGSARKNDPAFSLELVNAADTIFVSLTRYPVVRAFLNEAIAINAAALPAATPQSVSTLELLAQLEIVTGHRGVALDLLRRIAQARQSPLYRAHLAKAAYNFELLAWALIDGPTQPDRSDLNEAIEAIQWTQVTQSASALRYLETRLSIDDPQRSSLIRARQNLIESLAETTARVAQYQAGGVTGPSFDALSERVTKTEIDLAAADSRLNALGLDTTSIAQVSPVSLSDIQSMLGPQEVLITFVLPGLVPEYIQGLDRSSNHVIAITANGTHTARINEVKRAGLNQRITAFRCQVAIGDPNCQNQRASSSRGAMLEEQEGEPATQQTENPFDYQSAHALYNDLFGGVQNVLESHSHLIIVPPADMLRLPFQALVTKPVDNLPFADAPWMIRQNAISVLPSIASLRVLRRAAPNERKFRHMLGFGDPILANAPEANCDALQYAATRAAPPLSEHMAKTAQPGAIALADVAILKSLARLPDSKCELQAIGASFGAGNAHLFLGKKATETRIKSLNKSGALSDFDVLVFATHGLTGGETGAASPGLVLTPPDIGSTHDDGLLSAAEISSFDLNAELVVLSACNTAAGESGAADGLSGLARAFFRAGARSLLVTHWSVYSQAAVDISTGVFDQLEQNPQARVSQALQTATLDILNDRQRPHLHHHPSYWAAFSIIGAS